MITKGEYKKDWRMKKIRILVIEPNKEPYQKKIIHTLKGLQNVVGGLIEIVELEHNVDLICNEEGKIYNLPINRIIKNDVICGTFFIAGHHKGETISLSRKQIKKYKREFKLDNDKIILGLLKNLVQDSSELLARPLIGIHKLKRTLNKEKR